MADIGTPTDAAPPAGVFVRRKSSLSRHGRRREADSRTLHDHLDAGRMHRWAAR